jgi:hypothetical protein
MSSTDNHELRSRTGQDQRPDAPARVRAALTELGEQADVVRAMPTASDAEWADKCARLAMIAARTTGWWGVLANHVYADHDTNTVYGRAALAARAQELDRARFWCEHARTWQARAERARGQTECDAESVTTAPVVVEGTADVAADVAAAGVADVAGEVDQ